MCICKVVLEESILREMGTKAMDEVEVVKKRFGDEQSTLLDRFERLSFEVHLNQAILGRSLSEPRAPRYQLPPLPLPPPPPVDSKVSQGRRHQHHHRGLRFQKVLKKLFSPIFGSRKEERKESIQDQSKYKGIHDHKNLKFMKAFSRSLRV